MSRIPYPDISKCRDDVRKIVESNPINVVRMLAHATPDVLIGSFAQGFAIVAKSRLPADFREIAVLRAGYIAGAKYETAQHESIAKSLGMTDAQIAAVKDGGKHPKVFTDAQPAVLDFADEFIVKVHVSDAALAAVRKHISDEQLMDLMFVTGSYMTTCRILEVTGVAIDDTLLDAGKIKEIATAAH